MPKTASIRGQLTAVYLGLFALLFFLFSLLIYAQVERSLVARLDATVAAEADTAAGLLPDEYAEVGAGIAAAAAEVAREIKLRDGSIAILDEGQILAASPDYGKALNTRVARRRVEVAGKTYQVEVTASVEPVERDLAILRGAILIGLPLVLLAAGFGGYAVASRSLRPVGEMADQARRITGNNLNTRIRIEPAAQELQVLITSFNELLSRLDQSFDTMRRFVADASHELRTPVSIIRGEADVALARDRTAAEYRDSLRVVLDESRRLSLLVDDLLSLARADAGRVVLRTEEFYLNEMIADCCRSVQGLAVQRGVEIECSGADDIEFRGDEQLLRRMVLNLLDNAIRYTPSGGRVTVSLENGDGATRILVKDTGIGIAAGETARIFERFYRSAEARSRRDGGFGLGLAIVRWIAECHRGSVECASEPGKGSTFTVSLPV